MTYQPLNQKEHFSKTTKAFEMLLQFADDTFTNEDLLIAADEFIHIGNGKVAAEKIKERAQTPTYYSRDTYSMMTNSPWKCVPSSYAYDEETFPELGLQAQTKLNNLINGVDYVS
tara:strand:+ start:214 stop:558 length:345 start_codon:yes stop_codon:yes gene_type:complete